MLPRSSVERGGPANAAPVLDEGALTLAVGRVADGRDVAPLTRSVRGGSRCERLSVQLDFIFRALAQAGQQDPSLAATEPYKAILAKDASFFAAVGEQQPDAIRALEEALARTWLGTTPTVEARGRIGDRPRCPPLPESRR